MRSCALAVLQVYHKTGRVEAMRHTHNVCASLYFFDALKNLSLVLTQELLNLHPNPADFLSKARPRGTGPSG